MRDELPPPVITIRDPNAPSPLSDVIGAGDDDERPRRQWDWRDRGLAALTVVVIATTGAGLWGVEHLHDEQRLDKASVTELNLNSSSDPESEFDFNAISLSLTNDGPHPVSVLSARVSGAAEIPTLTARHNTLKPSATSTVRFRRPVCPASLPPLEGSSFGSSELELTVRTYRGQTSRVTVTDQAALSSVLGGYYYTMQDHCRLYPPENSLLPASRLATVRQGKDLVLTVKLRNRSKVPRTLHELLAGGGLSAVTGTHDLEFAGGATHPVTVTLRVSECDRALQAWGTDLDELTSDPSSSYQDFTFGEVSMTVYGDGREDGRGLLLTSGYSQGIRPWVLAVCPKK